MPKIDVNKSLFYKLLEKNYSFSELEEKLTAAKAELDELPDESLPENGQSFKIELNDTNRPDLWSTAGLARSLTIHEGGKSNAALYETFLSSNSKTQETGCRLVKVDAALKDVRPFIAGFVISGKPIDSAFLAEIIQTQEKLCWNFGRKRKTAAMGVYRSQMITWPILYKACNPYETAFVPLGMEKKLSCIEILSEHPKGKEFGHILEGKQLFPILIDSANNILSMPPIINSAEIGAVKAGDCELFVELTGTDMTSVLLAANIVACDFADAGYKILPVKIDFEYDSPYGKSVTAPFYFQKPIQTKTEAVNKLLGSSLSLSEIENALHLMDCRTSGKNNCITVFPPPYRNDFLHEADIIEDVMLGKSVEFFTPEVPNEFTAGKLLPITILSRKVKHLMIGLGYQEMIFNYLGSQKDYIDRMCIDGSKVIEIANPMSENYRFVRSSILPLLLNAELNSGAAVYPHKIFEIGKTVNFCKEENTGTITRQKLGFLTCAQEADYNSAASEVAGLLYYLGFQYQVEETKESQFIMGRQAGIIVNGKRIGVFGEIHPQVLENWTITVPCFAGELDLEALMSFQ